MVDIGPRAQRRFTRRSRTLSPSAANNGAARRSSRGERLRRAEVLGLERVGDMSFYSLQLCRPTAVVSSEGRSAARGGQRFASRLDDDHTRDLHRECELLATFGARARDFFDGPGESDWLLGAVSHGSMTHEVKYHRCPSMVASISRSKKSLARAPKVASSSHSRCRSRV